MDIKKEKYIAYGVVVALFVVGVVCYALPGNKPEKPVRAMMDTALNATQKKVLFFHKEHSERENYGLECIECHHKWVEAESEKPTACNECHKTEKAEGDDPKQPILKDALHTRCGGCHDNAGHGPGTQDCAGCHSS